MPATITSPLAHFPAPPPPCPRPPPRRTLADLQLPHACREVVDKGADAVLDEIEGALVLVAASILRGEGFAYTLPNRSKGNQLYVPGGWGGVGRGGVGQVVGRPPARPRPAR